MLLRAGVGLIAVAAASVATLVGALELAVVGGVAILAGFLGMRSLGALAARAQPVDLGHLLLYAYAASIPVNNLLPPGPAGTIARIIGILFFVGSVLNTPGVLRFDTVPTAGWLFAAFAFASSLWAIAPETSVQTWLSLAQLFAITVLIASIVSTDRTVVRGTMWSYAVAATITAVVAVAIGLTEQANVGRAAAFEDQSPAQFAGLLVPAVLFLMFEAQSATTGRLIRVAAAAFVAVGIVAILLSGTRAAWLAVLIGTAWSILRHPTRQQVWLLGATAVAVAAVLAANPSLLEFVVGRAESSFRTGGSGRTDIWTVGFNILLSAPLVGVGFGNFPDAFTPYAIWEATGASHAGGALFAGRDPHNVLLGTAVETGMVGVILLGGFLGYALLAPRGSRIADVASTMIVGMLAVSMFADLMLRKEFWLVIAVSLGVAHAMSRAAATDEVEEAPARAGPAALVPAPLSGP